MCRATGQGASCSPSLVPGISHQSQTWGRFRVQQTRATRTVGIAQPHTGVRLRQPATRFSVKKKSQKVHTVRSIHMKCAEKENPQSRAGHPWSQEPAGWASLPVASLSGTGRRWHNLVSMPHAIELALTWDLMVCERSQQSCLTKQRGAGAGGRRGRGTLSRDQVRATENRNRQHQQHRTAAWLCGDRRRPFVEGSLGPPHR